MINKCFKIQLLFFLHINLKKNSFGRFDNFSKSALTMHDVGAHQ